MEMARRPSTLYQQLTSLTLTQPPVVSSVHRVASGAFGLKYGAYTMHYKNTLTNNLLKGNGQYGAALIDCRGVLLDDNEVVRNGKGAVSGACDDDVGLALGGDALTV